MAVLAFRRDRLSAESGVTVGVADGNNSGEEDGLTEGRENSSEDFGGQVSFGTEILPFARFGGGESLVAGEDNGMAEKVWFGFFV